jgi:hypothetical protein
MASAAGSPRGPQKPKSLGGKQKSLEANMKILSLVSFVFFALILCATQAVAATTPPKGAVLTWHDDNFRTGWQQQETILTTATASKLGISHAVTLKDQVDAQPLVIPSFINGHDIVFCRRRIE